MNKARLNRGANIIACGVVALALAGAQAARAQIAVSGANCFTAHMVGGDKQVTWIDVKTQKPAVPPAADYQATSPRVAGGDVAVPLSVGTGAQSITDNFTHLYNPETGQEYELIACPPKGNEKPVEYQTPAPVKMDTTPSAPGG